MNQISQQLNSRVHDKGRVTRTITTQRGIIKVWSLIESRGSSTGFTPKQFKYVELPGNVGIFPYRKEFEKHWKRSGFI